MSSCVLLENLRNLDPDASQGVDVEEAAVVDVARCDPPVGQAVGLRLQQTVQGVEAFWITGTPLMAATALSMAFPQCR